MSLRAIFALLLLVAFTGCTTTDVTDSFRTSDSRRSLDDKLRYEFDAPIIVEGRVCEFTEVGAPRRSPGAPRIKSQPNKIKISVEHVAKGNIASSSIEFYYFTFSSASDVDLGVPFYRPAVGQHRIFFLKRWRDTYRSVGDVMDYTLVVSSGVHEKGICRGKSPGCCVAEILLVPGSAPDIYWFSRSLVKSEYVARTVCSPSVGRNLLVSLTNNPNGEISGAARAILSNPTWTP
jgi:hypothetical protein